VARWEAKAYALSGFLAASQAHPTVPLHHEPAGETLPYWNSTYATEQYFQIQSRSAVTLLIFGTHGPEATCTTLNGIRSPICFSPSSRSRKPLSSRATYKMPLNTIRSSARAHHFSLLQEERLDLLPLFVYNFKPSHLPLHHGRRISKTTFPVITKVLSVTSWEAEVPKLPRQWLSRSGIARVESGHPQV